MVKRIFLKNTNVFNLLGHLHVWKLQAVEKTQLYMNKLGDSHEKEG